MDWSNNIPSEKSRTAKRSRGLPSFLELIGWTFIAFIAWFLWTLFSPPIMQQMFGPLLVFFGVFGGIFMIAGMIMWLIWQIISWPFRRG